MIRFCGKGVCGGVAMGKVSVFSEKESQIRRIHIENTETESEKFEKAKQLAKNELSEIYEKALIEVGKTNAAIFEIHMMMLEDEDYNESVLNIIKTQKVNAEYAVTVTGENFAAMFAAMDDAYMQARQADVKDISMRLVRCMDTERDRDDNKDENVIICALDLSPSRTVLLDKSRVLAFVTAYGSSNSHTAILARNMNIPAVIGVGETILSHIRDGDFMVVDGSAGEIYVNPDKDTMQRLLKKQSEEAAYRERLKNLKGKENITLDGKRINIYANIGDASDVGEVLYNDAGGIGLFRSEFLYLGRNGFPSEQEQFEVYKTVLESMAGKKVIIRTLDVGADKRVPYFGLDDEENPALGMRAIRICLTRPEVFKTQLRALYRASAFGNLAIMFPMIADVWELEAALEICREIKAELDKSGIAYNKSIETGIMIETPAAALISERLAPLSDFFSIGTNDLTQYTLACDRQNPKLERFCDTHHEAVLQLIRMSAENAHKNGAWVGICGELASDESLTEAFLRMGIDELSVSPSHILKLRETVRKTDLSKK